MSDHGEETYNDANGGEEWNNNSETPIAIENGVKEEEDEYNSAEKISNTQENGNRTNERELASEVVIIQNKRYYLDVKENMYGKFVKLAQVIPNRPKQRIVLAMDKVVEFRNVLSEFGEFYVTLGPPPEIDNQTRGGILKNKMINARNRKYWLDLKDTPRGRILKVSQILTKTNQRSIIIIPAQGIIELRNKLTHLIEEYATEEDLRSSENKNENMRIGNKRIYFETRSNPRGRYLRISELRNNITTSSMIIPENSLDRFKDVLSSLIEDMKITSEARKAALPTATN
ncbi:unnamed protein product [Gordionus sp. m RMFG-2023]|uniref:transcriptional activator protein Pur-alpha-like n=1 Tax=Gordionus sp. m RMFG-2023 TaxID=3053472 RepID=UPI0030E4B799